MKSQSPLAQRVAQIKNAIIESNLTLREMQGRYGIPTTTLNKVTLPGWNPRLDTLLRLEKAFFGKKDVKKNV